MKSAREPQLGGAGRSAATCRCDVSTLQAVCLPPAAAIYGSWRKILPFYSLSAFDEDLKIMALVAQ